MTAPKPAPPADAAPAKVEDDAAPVKSKGPKFSNADAAKVLRCYESEVASVDTEGVATTTDGQRYLIDGDEYVWLRTGSDVPQILGQ